MVPNFALLKTEPFVGNPGEPKLWQFDKNGKQLIFVAAIHDYAGLSTEANPNSTFILVKSAIEEKRPGTVILEGIPTSLGETPQMLIDSGYTSPKADGSFQYGEASYAGMLAQRRHIPFIGGKPDNEQIAEKLSSLNYSKNDVEYFHLLRSIEGKLRIFQKENNIDESVTLTPEQEKLFFDFLVSCLPPNDRPNQSDFENWYKTKRPPELANIPFWQVTSNDWKPFGYDPNNLNDMSFFQRMAHLEGQILDKHLIQTIVDQFEKYDVVTVVFGAWHLKHIQPVLEDMLGPGTYTEAMQPPRPPQCAPQRRPKNTL